jgi:hypothetical protein
MPEPAKKRASYEDLSRLPENVVGEIIDGELIVTPRPSRKHTMTSTLLGGEIVPPYFHGRGGGPGGWIIIIEPEVGFGQDCYCAPSIGHAAGAATPATLNSVDL